MRHSGDYCIDEWNPNNDCYDNNINFFPSAPSGSFVDGLLDVSVAVDNASLDECSEGSSAAGSASSELHEKFNSCLATGGAEALFFLCFIFLVQPKCCSCFVFVHLLT